MFRHALARSLLMGLKVRILNGHNKLFSNELAYMQVVAERSCGEKSKFWPYLQTLPKGIGGLPIFFRPDEVAALQYPPLVQQVNMRCRWLLKFSTEQLSDAKQAALFNHTTVDANLLGEVSPLRKSTRILPGIKIGPCAETPPTIHLKFCNIAGLTSPSPILVHPQIPVLNVSSLKTAVPCLEERLKSIKHLTMRLGGSCRLGNGGSQFTCLQDWGSKTANHAPPYRPLQPFFLAKLQAGNLSRWYCAPHCKQ